MICRQHVEYERKRAGEWGGTLALAIFLTMGLPGAYAADGNQLDRLSKVEPARRAAFTTVPQDGDNAKAIKKILEQIKLPKGFKIALYALAPGARHMAVGPQGSVTFVGTHETKVWAVTDRNKDNVADEVKNLAPAIDFTIPNGPCFSKDGSFYIVERNRVLVFPAAEANYEKSDIAAFSVVKQGELIPPKYESNGHTARACRIGPDDKLYITLGQPHNVPPQGRLNEYNKWGIGGIIRINTDGAGREVYTYGVRNSVGLDFSPNGDLWFTDNQVDGMGDNIPPGEINHQTKAGQDFGFPWYGGGSVRTKQYQDAKPPADTVMPAVEMDAHAADLGMTFYTGKQFPKQYRGGIFSAQHGSWDRREPIGARVMFTPVGEDGKAGRAVPFAEGWNKKDEYLGRPVDVAQLPDGSLLVSDDYVGALYRIWYEE